MTRSRNCTAIKAGLALALLFIGGAANAAPIGTVAELEGNLLVSRADGSVKVLGVGSAIEQGDLLTSRKDTYVTLALADDSAVTLGPDTDLKVERYSYYKHTPDHDGALFALARGTVHITAGVLGTRSGDTFQVATPTVTLDVAGATVVVEYVAPDAARATMRGVKPGRSPFVPVGYDRADGYGFVKTTTFISQYTPPASTSGPAPPSGTLPPGLYVHVIDGLIMMSNAGGSTNFTAGQFGYTPNFQQPPTVLPANPGLKFTPPPTFSMPATPGMPPAKSGAVDCEVR